MTAVAPVRRGVRTWLHYDNNGCHNLNAQICGHKRCWLYAPDQLQRMHPFLLGSGNPAHNAVPEASP